MPDFNPGSTLKKVHVLWFSHPKMKVMPTCIRLLQRLNKVTQ